MTTRYLRWPVGALFAITFAAAHLSAPTAQNQKDAQPQMSQVPGNVMDSLKTRFPKAEILKWTREKEGDFVVYDFEFTQGGRKFEADIKEDGTIHNWEEAISFKKLPGTAKKVVNDQYPNASIKEVMRITAVNQGKEELEGYEIVLRTADKKTIEVTLAADGRFVEEEIIPPKPGKSG